MSLFSRDTFVAPVKGKIISLSEVKDEMFSKGMLGDGLAIEMKEGNIYAPCAGEITLVFPTLHAYGLKTKDGKEILMHVGIDTVNLEGRGFKSYVTLNERVKQGQLIASVNMELLEKQGYDPIVLIVFTSGELVKVLKNGDCECFEKDIIKIDKR